MRRACARKLFLRQLRVTTDPFSASVTVASKPGGSPSRSVSPAPLGFASPGHSPSGARTIINFCCSFHYLLRFLSNRAGRLDNLCSLSDPN
jgi:hypothetical protein